MFIECSIVVLESTFSNKSINISYVVFKLSKNVFISNNPIAIKNVLSSVICFAFKLLSLTNISYFS